MSPQRPRRETAGPLILLVLIAGAFVPSLFMQFDLARLAQDLKAPWVQASGDPQLAPTLPEEAPSTLSAELPPPLQVSEDLRFLSLPLLSLPGPGSGAPALAPLARRDRPPGRAPSPRSPPGFRRPSGLGRTHSALA